MQVLVWFLIHYGWRGTICRTNTTLTSCNVSNPLRLEGDTPKRTARAAASPVSNPLRLEGDIVASAATINKAEVSNPLRLEGDELVGSQGLNVDISF